MVKTTQHTIENPLGSPFHVLVSAPEPEIDTPKSPISMVVSTGANPAAQSLMAYVYAIGTARDVYSTVLVDTVDDTVRETATRIAKLCAKKSSRPCYLGVAGDGGAGTLALDQLLLCRECVKLVERAAQ
ncbi:hypothetical protein ACU8KH_02171 [Lachancea thermotolerans]|uniref:KLTH0D10780p n=1 Tax=Lachancea thermotolerans (strain ATCC 56472 / CBS 6340 / NRRL Y-8284) TaxID=559295 RepID=C5DEY5_LACTC|nr:KLTH0D10780p [Lachancea thermotolerans CBS 6340]CAR22740.1 KLTH0D10780p [Lachancea thermotolerans CBS 6340]